MSKYSSEKSHNEKHLTHETAIEKKLNTKLISNNRENNITINMTEQMDMSKMSKLELLEKCKELGITKCSSKKNHN